MGNKWPKDTRAITENQWNKNLSEFVKLIEEGGKFWCVDTDLKYLNIRVDTRDGHFIILDDEKENRIEPDRVINAIEEWKKRYD